MNKIYQIHQHQVEIIQLLGHGKGGYSYLVKENNHLYVLKKIHHEPCDYYTFGNKIEAEKNDYQRLKKAQIRVPNMIDIDMEKEILLKEYIEGMTIDQLILHDQMKKSYLDQVREMAKQAKENHLNLDYFPTNFVVHNDLVYYIDYECNDYMEEWSFENWGIHYWSKTKQFLEHFHS